MKDLRDWIQLFFVVVGGILAFVAFFQNLRQRRVENALKFVALFRDGLHEGDLAHWRELHRASSELCGAKPGHYLKEWEHFRPIADYFSEGAPDGHAMSRMAAALEVVCHQVNSRTADARTVYYELGQLLNSMHDWLSCVPSPVGGVSLLQSSFPSIQTYFQRYAPRKAA